MGVTSRSGLSLSQAPAGLRAAVRRTLGDRGGSLSSPVQQAELTDPHGAKGDFFGASVAISGSTAVVGAADTPKLKREGAAYVFARTGTTWSKQAKLTDGATGGGLGSSVAISGSTAVVGAVGANSPTGAAYVFVRSGTSRSQQAELTPPSAGLQGFGSSVAIYGSTVLVGADQGEGAAYVFVRSGTHWSQQASFTGSGGFFGGSVALYGSTALVGEDQGKGAAYVFVRSGTKWSRQAKLTASNGTSGTGFGLAAALYGSTAVVGAYNANAPIGAAYVFVRSGTTWTQQAELAPRHGPAGGFFGLSVAIHGSTVAVGAPRTNTYTGTAYVFTRSGTTWSQRAKLTASDAAKDDYFGYPVALSRTSAVVGADQKNSITGAAYVFAGL